MRRAEAARLLAIEAAARRFIADVNDFEDTKLAYDALVDAVTTDQERAQVAARVQAEEARIQALRIEA